MYLKQQNIQQPERNLSQYFRTLDNNHLKFEIELSVALKKWFQFSTRRQFFSQKNDFLHYLLSNGKSRNFSTLTYFIALSVISAMIFIMVKPDAIKCDLIFQAGNNASLYDFETLIKESDEFRLLLRRSLLILRNRPPLNRYVTSIPLELFS